MSSSDENYIGVILEEIRGQNNAVLEAVGDMQKNVARIPKIAAGVDELKQDVKVIKAVITDQSHQLTDHENRITKLEAA